MQIWKLVVPAALLLAGALPAVASYEPARVDPQDVQKRQSAGENILAVDIRTPGAYSDEHIYGAANVPSDALKQGPRGLPKNRTLLLYCTCPEEHGAAAAAIVLHDRFGYRKLLVLRGGLDAWRDAGYKVVEAAAKPASRPGKPAAHLPRPTAAPTALPTPGPDGASPAASPAPKASANPAGSPAPKATATPATAPDQRDPMDEQRGTSQSPRQN